MSVAIKQKGYTPAPPQKRDSSAYDPATLPAREDGGSRFAIPVTPAGWPVAASENIVRIYCELVGARVGSVPSLDPDPVTVSLMWADKDGVRPRGAVTQTPTLANVRPGKLGKCKLTGGVLLDSLFLGGEAWEKATDRECFAALAQLADDFGLVGGALRMANDALCRLLLGRAGIPMSSSSELPHPFQKGGVQ